MAFVRVISDKKVLFFYDSKSLHNNVNAKFFNDKFKNCGKINLIEFEKKKR